MLRLMKIKKMWQQTKQDLKVEVQERQWNPHYMMMMIIKALNESGVTVSMLVFRGFLGILTFKSLIITLPLSFLSLYTRFYINDSRGPHTISLFYHRLGSQLGAVYK